jgi:hypothetical protein
MSVHRYSLQSLLGDYWRSAIGLIVAAGGLLLAPSTPHVLVICGGLTALFLLFTMRTIARQYSRTEVTEDAITHVGIRRTQLRWSDLDRAKLRYYSTRRNRAGGWMTLKLSGRGAGLAVDSNIDGFDAIAARAARAIADNRIGADDVTLANLAALGLATPAHEAPLGTVESPQ